MDIRPKKVIVVLTGGNICLIATQDKRREAATIHKPAQEADFIQYVLSGANDRNILIREKSIRGAALKVDFVDLRKETTKISVDPEELDSSQVDPILWQNLSELIYKNYPHCEGFVVLHGLDTMAYTASAVSFMLTKLQIPIVFVGSQRPLNYFRTDGVQSIRSAITLAGGNSIGLGMTIPEVSIFSHDVLLRANRTTMVHASEYRAFNSPNYPTLASFGEHINIYPNVIRKSARSKRVIFRKPVNATVSILDVYPGMDAMVISQLIKSKTLKGILLRTYGMGTAPTRKSILEALDEVVSSNIVVMNVTQARGGRISHGQDPVSLRLFEQGVISGVDMTAEAAYAKMVVVLSDQKYSAKTDEELKDKREVAEDYLQIDICGEQSQSIFHFHFQSEETRAQNDGSFRAFLKPKRDMVERSLLSQNQKNIMSAQLRLLGVEPVRGTDTKMNRAIDFDAYLVSKYQDVDDYEVVTTLRQDVLRWFSTGKATINMAYNITDAVEHLLNPDTFLRIDTIEPIKWKRLTIAIYATASL